LEALQVQQGALNVKTCGLVAQIEELHLQHGDLDEVKDTIKTHGNILQYHEARVVIF